MKERVSIEQIMELSMEQRDKLRELWQCKEFDVVVNIKNNEIFPNPVDDSIICEDENVIPLLSVGQMIGLLDNISEINKRLDGWWVHFVDKGEKWVGSVNEELCDVLWEMLVREKL